MKICDICNSTNCYHLSQDETAEQQRLNEWFTMPCPRHDKKFDNHGDCVTCGGFGHIRYQMKSLKEWRHDM